MNGVNPAVAIGRVFSIPGNSAENPVRVCQVNNKIKKLEIAILSAASSAAKEATAPSRNGVTREVTMAKTNLPSV